MADGPLGRLIRVYIQRVINDRDLSGVDELVSRDYVGRGDGWPTTFAALRQFYALQALERPDWHIDVQETLELAEIVVVRARAGGRVAVDGTSRRRSVEWLALYRVQDALIREINLLAIVEGSVEGHDGEWEPGGA